MSVDEHPQQQKPPVLDATQARSGFRGRHVLWVLVISMALVVVIYGVMVGRVQTSHLAAPGGQTTIDQKTFNETKGFNAPPSQPRQSENPQTTPTITPAPTNGQGQGH